MKKDFICLKKSVRTFKLRIEPYFLSHAERGESLQNQDFVGGMQNRRRFAPTIFLVRKPFLKICGGGEIRTLETLSSLPPFQGGALYRYATPPFHAAEAICTRPLCDVASCHWVRSHRAIGYDASVCVCYNRKRFLYHYHLPDAPPPPEPPPPKPPKPPPPKPPLPGPPIHHGGVTPRAFAFWYAFETT